jgi:methylenetetrahydrofolate reductase (NADPH)
VTQTAQPELATHHKPTGPIRLTAREHEVLVRRAAGASVAEIACALVIEPRTVKFHLRNVYAKLGLAEHSRAARQVALVRYAPADNGDTGSLSQRFLFRPDRTVTQVLARGRFTLSAEVVPPRNGAEQAAVLGQVAQLIDAGAQFLAVTKGAGGSLRGGSLPIALAIKEQFGVPCIAHFTCRDLTPEEVENQLIDHHYCGVRNILALRGDPPDGQPDWQPLPGSHKYAHQLISQITALNAGNYLPRAGGPEAEADSPTDFCVGAAVYPEHPNPEERIAFFKQKVDSGAQFAITQMVFDADAYGRFLDRCERASLNVPVLPGTRVLRSRASARRTAEKYGVSLPETMLRTLPRLDDPNAAERTQDVFLGLVERLRCLGAPGIHLFVTDVTAACGALAVLSARSPKQGLRKPEKLGNATAATGGATRDGRRR